MDPVRTGVRCRQRVDDTQTAVVVAVPVYLDIGLDLVDQLASPGYEVERTFGRGVSDGVGQADPAGTALDRATVQRFESVGTRARGVFGYIHDRQVERHRIGNGVRGVLQHGIYCPALGILSDRTRANEQARLNGDTCIL